MGKADHFKCTYTAEKMVLLMWAKLITSNVPIQLCSGAITKSEALSSSIRTLLQTETVLTRQCICACSSVLKVIHFFMLNSNSMKFQGSRSNNVFSW